MGDFLHQFLAFNRGLVSPLALARIDLKRLALAADVHTNWLPRTLGPMMLRPGLSYLGSTAANGYSAYLDFVFNNDDALLIELTGNTLRAWVDDVLVASPAVTTCFGNWNGSAYVASALAASTFADSTDLGYWHQNDQSGGTSSLASGGGLELIGNGTASGIRDRQIDVVGANVGLEHRVTIVVARGNVTMRLGTSEGDDSYLTDRELRPGTHSIAITPSGPYYIRLASANTYAAVVSSVTIVQAGGAMTVPTPWATANLDYMRWVQSGDVLFVGCKGIPPYRIERQDRINTPASRSWSVVQYLADDGPFGTLNTGPVQLQGSATSGEITLQASQNYFKAAMVGQLFRLTSAGQDESANVTGANTFTNPIEVTGVGATGRSFSVVLTGPTFSSGTTVTLQRSVGSSDGSSGSTGPWTDVQTWNGPTSVSIYDNLDNQIVYYRIGVKSGNFTSGDDLNVELIFSAGTQDGIVRVTGYTDGQHVSASVLQQLGAANTYTQNWYAGDWSPLNGWPSSVEIFDGRMWWFGAGMVWGSVSDLYDSFDDTVQGDSGPIRTSLGAGPVDQINWGMGLYYLMIGGQGAIQMAQSSALGQPLTPTAFSLKPVSTSGTSAVRAVKLDSYGILVGRNGSRIYQLSPDPNLYSVAPYQPKELTDLNPDLGTPAFKRIAVQRNRDTYVHVVRSDGTACVCLLDNLEQVVCWFLVQTQGTIEDVVVLPGTSAAPLEDQVYYVVNRIIGGQTVRYLEKWALQSQVIGATDNRISDSQVVVQGPGTTIAAPHLAGQEVVLWLDGKCPMTTDANGYNVPVTYTVASDGTITPDAPFTQFACAGLPYTSQWRCAKLAAGENQFQAPLNEYKKIDHIGFVLANTHPFGLRYGPALDDPDRPLDELPQMEEDQPVDPDAIWASYDYDKMEFDGSWDTDPRICLQGQAPLPCTVMGLTIKGVPHD